jgi:hypothetical protein
MSRRNRAGAAAASRPAARQVRLGLEVLEGRSLPSSFTSFSPTALTASYAVSGGLQPVSVWAPPQISCTLTVTGSGTVTFTGGG